jgi:hypothetical protein
MRSAVVVLMLSVALVAGPPARAAVQGCVTVVGICQIEQDAEQTCRCETPLGSIPGESKKLSDFDVSSLRTAFIEHAARIRYLDLDIQIFAKKTDRTVIDDWLTSLDPKIKRESGNPNPALVNDDTNAIWFSEDAPKEAVRAVAILLIERGLKIKSIQLYYPDAARNLPVRHNLIQIGASSANRAREPLTASQVTTASLPMFGDLTANP